jgi:hypothetical protein
MLSSLTAGILISLLIWSVSADGDEEDVGPLWEAGPDILNELIE